MRTTTIERERIVYKKSIFFIIIVLLTMFSGCQNKGNSIAKIKKRGVITVITNAVFPPFEYYKGREIQGIDIDIANEIAKDLGVKLEILDMNFDGLVVSIASGKGDFVAAGLTIDENKTKAITFSNEYIKVPQSLIVKKENLKINNVFDIKNKKIGVQIGTTSDKYVKDELDNGFLKDSDTKVIAKKEYLDLVTDLRNNRLDVIALDGFIAEQLIRRNNDLRFFDRDNESYALAVKKGNDELLNEINSTIKRLINSNKIREFYFNHCSE